MVSSLTSADLAKLGIPRRGADSSPTESRPATAKDKPSITLDSRPKTEPVDPEIEEALAAKAKYAPLAFKDGVQLLYFLDDNFEKGRKTLHLCQIEEIQRLCRTDLYSFKEPLRHLIVAANGSGKDAYINAIVAIWKLVARVRTRTIITSASFDQLNGQTENYVRLYASRVNERVHPKVVIIKRGHIVCPDTGSEIILRVTDDPGRAEGYHPFPDVIQNYQELLQEPVVDGDSIIYPGGDLTIIQNEAKTIPDDINEAFLRCTFNVLLKISTPGHTAGHLYNDSRKAVEYPAPYDRNKIYLRRITSYDCPHISRIKIDYDKEYFGESSPIFRSKHLALFTSIGEQVVILRETITNCLEHNAIRLDIGLGRRAGLDLAQGGDENTLYVFDENILIGYEAFSMDDTHSASSIIIKMFHKWQLKEQNIFADDGVAGKPLVDNIWAAGWRINRVLNQSTAALKRDYGNKGAELWFNFARLIQEKILNLKLAPAKAIDQLSSRYYKQQDTLGKLILESKKDAKLKGHGSPDHADAMVLAFAGVTIEDYRGKRAEAGDKDKRGKVISPEEAVFQQRDAYFEQLAKHTPTKKLVGRNFQSLIHKLTSR